MNKKNHLGLLKKRKIINRYNNQSYVDIYENRYKKIQYSKLNALFNLIPKNWSPFQKIILDFGGGTGLLNQYLSDILLKKIKKVNSINKLRIINLDISIQMLKKSYKSIENPINICADGENIPIRSKSIESVFSLTSLQNLTDLSKGLKEIKRILDKSGQIFFTFLKKSDSIDNLLTNFELIWNLGLYEIDIKNYSEDLEDWIGILNPRT